MRRLKNVVISGCGPAGLVTGLMLKNSGIKVTLLERVPKSQLLSDIGGAYDLYPNTVSILKHINAYKDVEAKSEFYKSVYFYNKNGEIFRNLPTSTLMGSGTVATSSLRSIIQSSLINQLTNNIEIKCDSKVIDYKEIDNKTIKVICDDDIEYECDLLIAADGIWSKIGQQLIQRNNENAQPNYCNVQAFWGRSHSAIFDDNAAHVWMAPGLNFVGANVRDQMGQKFFIWSAMCYSDKLETFSANVGKKIYVQNAIKTVSDENVIKILETTEEDDILDVGIFDRDTLKSWSNKANNVLLIGDAAHPMTPFLGQGANTAITDAFILCKILEKYQYDVDKLNDVVNIFESMRMDNVYSKLVYPARSLCKRMMSPSPMMQFAVQTMLKFSPASMMGKEMINYAKANDVSTFL
eukprot:214423_1